MLGRQSPDIPLHVRFVGGIAANLVPLVGVLAWKWSLWSLLVVYWFEAASSVLFAAVKSLLAERGSPGIPGRIEPLHELREKRGGWRIREKWPPVYPRNVPFAVSLLSVWFGIVGPVSVLYWQSVGPVVALSVDLVAGMFALLAAQTGDFLFEYLQNEEYRNVSAQELVQGPAQLTLIVLSVGLVGTGGSRSGGLLVLLAIVLGKTAASVYRFYVEHVGETRIADRLATDRSESKPELTVPDAPVRARVAADRKSVLVGSLISVGFGFVTRIGLGSIAVLGVGLLVDSLLWTGVGAVLVAGVAAARVLSYYLRYGTVEYQRRGDTLVAFDRLLEAPQWVATIGPATEFSVQNAIVDRLRGTGRLDITDDETVQLGPLTDIDDAVKRLDLPVTQTARPEQNTTVVAVTAVLLLAFAAVPGGLFLTPSVDNGTVMVLLVVLGPLVLIHVVTLAWVGLSRI